MAVPCFSLWRLAEPLLLSHEVCPVIFFMSRREFRLWTSLPPPLFLFWGACLFSNFHEAGHHASQHAMVRRPLSFPTRFLGAVMRVTPAHVWRSFSLYLRRWRVANSLGLFSSFFPAVRSIISLSSFQRGTPMNLHQSSPPVRLQAGILIL